MSIEKLTLVNIVGKMDSLDDTILRCLEREDFHPERSLDYTGQIRGWAFGIGKPLCRAFEGFDQYWDAGWLLPPEQAQSETRREWKAVGEE